MELAVAVFDLDEGSYQTVKTVLEGALREGEIRINGESREALLLDEKLSPKEFYALMAILIQAKTHWG